jgi:hypothetical protein
MSTRIDDPRIQIAVETPNFPEAPGHAELQAIGSGDGRPPLIELAARGWLDQAEHTRGTRLATVGLRLYAAHPELEMNNVPTMLADGAVRLMKELAGYVMAGGRLEEGDVMQMRDSLPCLVGFVDTSRVDSEDDAVVRVVFLS